MTGGVRAKEEEKKQKERKKELLDEKMRKQELRQKRNEDKRKQLGLEFFDDAKVEAFRQKVKGQMKELEEKNLTQKVHKLQDHLNQEKREKPQLLIMMNRDLKEAIKEGIANEDDNKDPEQLKLERKKLLKEQKLKRKQQKLEQQQKDLEEKLRKEQALQQLHMHIKAQAEEERQKQMIRERVQEERERLQKELEELQQKQMKKKKQKNNKGQSHKEQFNELKDWIDEQMQKGEEILDKMDETVIEQPSKIDIKITTKSKDPSVNNSMAKDIIQLKKKQKQHSPQKDQSMSGHLIPFDGQRMTELKHDLPCNSDLDPITDQKYGVRDNRYGLFGDNGYLDLVEIKRREIDPPLQAQKQQEPEVMLSKEGFVQIISKIKDYHQAKEQQLKDTVIQQIIKQQAQQRVVINRQQSEVKPQNLAVPGVVDIEKEMRRQKEEWRKKELKAVIVIQKWARGFFARAYAREIRETKRREIESEYGYFEDQVKFNAEYNLQKFLKEKQKLREVNKTKPLAESSSIQEKIGDSSNSQSRSFRGKSAPQAVMKPQVQNFFQRSSDKDPLSLISIYAKKHAPKVVPSVVKSPVRIDQQRRGTRVSQSDIEEEIYSEAFEDEEAKSRITDKDIDEDIVEGSKGLSSSSIKESDRLKKPFVYKQSASIIEESIQEDNLSRSRRSPDRREDSIMEESGLNYQASKSSALKQTSLREDSIPEEYQDNSFHSYSGSAKLTRAQQQKQMTSEFDKKIKEDEAKRKRLVNEMLDEMKRYEQASMSTVVVERMEKIITKSLAQKDKILLAQRLSELEQQKQHQEEINKIREEQIKFMSLLMLQGGFNNNQVSSDEDKQRVMEEIRKIIDKPIIIQRQEIILPQQEQKLKKIPEVKVSPQDSDDYEEKSDPDYIQESKGLSRFGKSNQDHDDEDSIQESIHKDEESIAEEIEGSIQQSEDDIKESIHVQGKKQKESRDSKNDIQKFRMAMGSEEALRTNSIKALKKNQDQKNSGLFVKDSFQDFTSKKLKEILRNPKILEKPFKEIEHEIELRKIRKHESLIKKQKANQLTPRTFHKRSEELEKWAETEKRQLQIDKQKFKSLHLDEQLDELDKNKKSMMEKIGSPRVPRNYLTESQSSSYYNDGEIEEDSNESLKIRQARDQLRQLNQVRDEYDPEQKEIEKKKRAAKKLTEMKEKAIEEGIRQKLKNIERQQADHMLSLALNLNVNKEVEKRIEKANATLLEESSKLDEYSARGSVSQSMGVVSEDPKKKKNVKFASPERFSSVHSYDQSSSGVSSGRYKSHQHAKIDDSIGESIKIEESYSVSQHTAKVSGGSLKKSSSKDKIQESIKESITENEDYYEDFEQSSATVKSVQNNLVESRNRLQAKADSNKDEEDEIEYSMNFEESVQSQHLLPLNQQSVSQLKQCIIIQQKQSTQPAKVEEESQEEEEDEKSENMMKSQSSKVKDSDEVQEEEVVSESVEGTSSKLVDSSAIDFHEEDKEILYSAKSVEWIVNLDAPVESQRSKKQSSDEQYSEDFIEDEEEAKEDDQSKQIDELDDLESYPDEEDEEDDLHAKADQITDEFLSLLLQEVKQNQDLNLDKKAELEEFKDKFPFNLEPPIEEEVKFIEPQLQVQQQSQSEPKKEEVQKKETVDDQLRAKYEKEVLKQLEIQNKVSQYIDMIIKGIDRIELIKALEKPVQIDPIKKLAQIFSQEPLDESMMNESNSVSLLTLDYFKNVEDEYQKNSQSNQPTLTDSQRKSYLTQEGFHHLAIFQAFNQALELERPYRDRGKPAPWSKQTRVVQPKITESQLDVILKKSKERVLNWSKTQAGTKIASLPPPPPANQDFENQAPQHQMTTEEDRMNQAREERLGILMMRELEENENKWVDYEDEETQAKFDLADMVLEELAGEFANLMMNLQERKL